MELQTFRITGRIGVYPGKVKTRDIQVAASLDARNEAKRAFQLFWRAELVEVVSCEELATLQTLSAEVTPAQINLFNN